MRDIEDRLAAALRARTELVQPEDLRPLEQPAARPVWFRRPATYALVAAACAAAIAVPFIVNGDRDGKSDPGPSTDGPSPTASADGEGADWPVVDRLRTDLDGDGAPDLVRMRNLEGDLLPGPLRIEAELSDGGEVFTILRDPGLSFYLSPGPNASDDSDAGVIVSREVSVPGDPPEVTVLTLVDGELVEAEAPADPPIASTYDGRTRARDWWVTDGDIFSSRSVEGFENNGHDILGHDRYRVDVWRWQLKDGRLVAEELGEQCMDISTDEIHRPKPCIGDSDEPVDGPEYFPAATDTIQLGESFSAHLDLGGLKTIALEGTATQPSLSIEGDGVNSAVSLEPSPLGLFVSTTPVRLGGVRMGILVTRSGADSAEMQVYALEDGGLVPVESTMNSVQFGHAGSGSPDITWLSGAGELFTRRPVSDGPTGQFAIWRWRVDGGALVAESLDPVCFDFGSPVTWQACG
jgi:hypothetical protein